MRMIVGLGNPGKAYEKTRHNVGFMVVDALAAKWQISFNNQTKFQAEIATITKQEKVLLVKPTTFMNLSGQAVSKIANYYQVTPQDIIVIYDDMDLPLGKLRLREKGSGGGHNGIKNIVQCLNTQEIPRIRIGVGKHPQMDQKAFVLGKFSPTEQTVIEESVKNATEALEMTLSQSFVKVMSQYNQR